MKSNSERKYYILDSVENVIGKFYVPYPLDSDKAIYPSWARVYVKEGDKFLIPKSY